MPLPADIRPGDVIAVPATGAYRYSMASTYNLTGRPPVIAAADGAARAVAADLSIPVRLLDGDLARLPVPDASCDVVVCSLILCCSSRVTGTFREIRSVLRPGGELRFYEHQRSNRWPVALLSGLVTPLWSRAADGCHPARDILAEVERAGFGVESLDRFAFRGFDHVVGVARPR
ncbi:methyltransferase domain-containing protein [Nonomuraea sp. NPDC049141]|uniref:class I SAM-dependent methyltransferase n=1 Tax=Nonomuraea sp. NPDC049141 TaxID=3155500 RepID=UPI0033C54B53